MINNQAKDLFQLQSELVDMKVDMVVSKTIDRVIEQIHDLRSEMHTEMHGIRNEMHEFRGDVNQRLTAVETKLGMDGAKRKGFHDRALDYIFRAGYATLVFAFLYVADLFLHFSQLIK